MPDTLTILKKYWGYDSFRPLQQEIADSVCDGNNVLALLPTGGGKSICFQVPGMTLDGITIVVSPLIALMKDQVDQLVKRGIKAAAIYSGLSKEEIDILLDNCIYGDIKFLYVSPERLQTELFIARAQKMNVNLLAIDEAHCISQWGYDFRPPYLQIAEFREKIKKVPVIALTATATEKVKEDILKRLEIEDAQLFQKSFSRDNLSYAVRKVEAKDQKLVNILQTVQGSGIVYVNTRKDTREVASLLIRNNISADFYHGGLTPAERSEKQANWIKNRVRIIVATNAFGMGIDKPDVRIVVHLDIPPGPEAYYQEAGRGGRDGEKAYAVILYNENDITELKEHYRIANPGLDYLKRVYQALANYLKIAEGAGKGQSYNFDIAEFTHQFNLKPREAFMALKKIENEGLLYLSDALQNPSKVRLIASKEDLYRYQIENKKHDPYIKAILRLYGGEMFSDFMKINESKIGKFMNVSTGEVKQILDKLHEGRLLVYNKIKEKPQIIFTRERVDATRLPVDAAMLRERARTENEKVEAMISYVGNNQRCRSQILLEYFGEVSYKSCGICDTCVKNKKKSDDLHHTYYHNQIVNTLKKHPYEIDALITEIAPEDEDELMDQIRLMLDKGEIKYNEHWELILKGT